ncbi:MAG: hypothetical protein JO316_16980 [Abitibacteriaceae bacterium]|nr:hypothetical protein [Abditibacteriaceae bacterium]
MNQHYRPEEDKGLKVVGTINSLIELLLGTGLLILVVVILLAVARPYFNPGTIATALGLPAGHSHFMI